MHPAKEHYHKNVLKPEDHLIMYGAVRPWHERIKNFFEDIIFKLFGVSMKHDDMLDAFAYCLSARHIKKPWYKSGILIVLLAVIFGVGLAIFLSGIL